VGIGLAIVSLKRNRGTVQRGHEAGQGFKLMAKKQRIEDSAWEARVREVGVDSMQADSFIGVTRIADVVVHRHDRTVALLYQQRRRHRIARGLVREIVRLLQEVAGNKITGRVPMPRGVTGNAMSSHRSLGFADGLSSEAWQRSGW
jgi:hypothetical protein